MALKFVFMLLQPGKDPNGGAEWNDWRPTEYAYEDVLHPTEWVS